MLICSDKSWEPYISKGQDTFHDSVPKCLLGSDTKLRIIWKDLQEFTRSVNLAFQIGQKMDFSVCQQILISVLYRLLLIDFSPKSSDQAFHVGMLAFSSNTFLQMKNFPIHFEKLSVQLRDTILGLDTLEDDSTLELKIWLLFVARLSIQTGNGDSWLLPEMRKTLAALSLTTWKSVKDKLKNYLWIGMLHDACGKKAFEDAIAG